MSLEVIFDSIKERIPDVHFTMGKKGENAAPPLVIWRPVSGRHLNPPHTGGGPGDDGPIMARQWEIEVICWHKTLQQTIQLANAFLAAAFTQLSRYAIRNSSEKWDVGNVTELGAACLINFQIVTPIEREKPTAKIITGINTTYDIE